MFTNVSERCRKPEQATCKAAREGERVWGDGRQSSGVSERFGAEVRETETQDSQQ